MPDSLGAEQVVPLLRGSFGSPYLYTESCESTQRLLTEHHPEGAVAVSEHQTAGRGRLGRRWEAPPASSILCSVLLRPPPPRQLPELSLVGGMATARTVERAIARPAEIKWPNDVLVGGRKVAGVLAEARGAGVVLGIGVNVNQTAGELPAEPRAPTASLFTVDGARRARAALLAELLFDLEQLYADWLESGLGSLAAELARRDCLRGRHVSVGSVSGRAVGIAPDGRLELDSHGERVLVASGDVTYDGS